MTKLLNVSPNSDCFQLPNLGITIQKKPKHSHLCGWHFNACIRQTEGEWSQAEQYQQA